MDKHELYAIDPATLVWQKSGLTADSGQCFELAPLPDGGVAVRDDEAPLPGPPVFHGGGAGRLPGRCAARRLRQPVMRQRPAAGAAG